MYIRKKKRGGGGERREDRRDKRKEREQKRKRGGNDRSEEAVGVINLRHITSFSQSISVKGWGHFGECREFQEFLTNLNRKRGTKGKCWYEKSRRQTKNCVWVYLCFFKLVLYHQESEVKSAVKNTACTAKHWDKPSAITYIDKHKLCDGGYSGDSDL